MAVASVSVAARAADTDFATWLVELRKEAMGLGISAETLDAALGDVTPHERVIELDRSQPEFNLTFDEYLAKFISDWRRQTGVKMMAEHSKILDKVSKKYGVQKRFLLPFGAGNKLWPIPWQF